MSGKRQYILGIDTSCDDTSMALVEMNTKKVVANVVSSQIKLHAKFGGIVPEMASRAHMENLSLVFEQVLNESGITLADIAAIAVTKTPGLIGCLLVGTSFAKGLAYQLQVPLYGINHLDGHLFSPFIGIEESDRQSIFPFLGLVVSGGHTAFYRVESFENVALIGQTVDDAAGEAFDKCAKMLGLGYPGGPIIDKKAQHGDDQAFAFKVARVKMGDEYLSFSGLKTAAHHHLSSIKDINEKQIDNLCASVQKGIVDALMKKMEYFISGYEFKAFALSGGVAMNTLLRKRCQEECDRFNIPCYIAKPEYCTDNGAMIAHVALIRNLQNELFTLSTQATQKIQARRLKYEKIHS